MKIPTILLVLAVLAVPAAAEFKCLELDADSSCTLKWGGASGTLQVEDGINAFNGAPSVTLEWKAPSAAAFEQIEAEDCTFTAAGFCNFSIGRGDLKIVVTGGTGADIVSAFVSDEHEAALGAGVSSSGVVAGKLTMEDDTWIGLGGAAGRIEFDDQATDEVNIIDANFGVGTATPLVKLDVVGSSRITGTATSVLTGSIDPTASSAVVGVGTLFTTELIVGDRITVTGETRRVTVIADNLNLTVAQAFTDNGDDVSPDKLPAELVLRDSSGTVDLVVRDDGQLILNRLVSHLGNHGAFPPATCEVNGAPFLDTDETDDTRCATTIDNSLCCCVDTDTWELCADPSEPTRAFGAMTFHGIATDTVAISTAGLMTKVRSFSVAKDSDASGNVIVDVTDDDLEATLGGEYDIAYDISLSSSGGGSRETVMAAGIELVSPLVITGVTNATPMVVTISGHGLDNGDMVDIVDVIGTTAANGSWIVNASDVNTFEIYDLMSDPGVGNGAYISGGTVPVVFDSLTIAHLEVANNTISTNSGGVIGGVHRLSSGDKVTLWIANVDDAADYDVDAVALGMIRLGS